MLPTPVAAYMKHLRRAAFAIPRDKPSLSPKPDLSHIDQFGLELKVEKLKSVPSTDPIWPDEKLKILTFNCKKGCSHNCPCGNRNVSCFVDSLCTGTKDTWYRANSAVNSEGNEEGE